MGLGWVEDVFFGWRLLHGMSVGIVMESRILSRSIICDDVPSFIPPNLLVYS